MYNLKNLLYLIDKHKSFIMNIDAVITVPGQETSFGPLTGRLYDEQYVQVSTTFIRFISVLQCF